MRLDADGLPVLPEGHFWKFKGSLVGSWSWCEVRRHRALLWPAAVWSMMYQPGRETLNEAAEQCYMEWQAHLLKKRNGE